MGAAQPQPDRRQDSPAAYPQRRILLISSSGGHWVQMSRLAPAFDGFEVYYCSTEKDYAELVPAGRYWYIPDASRTSGIGRILRQAGGVLRVLLIVRPDVVLTTGAAPGFFAVLFGSKLGMRTAWVDSIANVDEVSYSGRKAARYADLYITQWEHLASGSGPGYYGSVL